MMPPSAPCPDFPSRECPDRSSSILIVTGDWMCSRQASTERSTRMRRAGGGNDGAAPLCAAPCLRGRDSPCGGILPDRAARPGGAERRRGADRRAGHVRRPAARAPAHTRCRRPRRGARGPGGRGRAAGAESKAAGPGGSAQGGSGAHGPRPFRSQEIRGQRGRALGRGGGGVDRARGPRAGSRGASVPDGCGRREG